MITIECLSSAPVLVGCAPWGKLVLHFLCGRWSCGSSSYDAESERRGTNPPPPPTTYTHPTAAHRAAAGRQEGPPWSKTGPPEGGRVPAPAQQHARARSARHTQAKQGTRAAPHASTHHGTKHDTTTANTHTRRRTSRQEQVQAPQSPQRNSRLPDGCVCARQ